MIFKSINKKYINIKYIIVDERIAVGLEIQDHLHDAHNGVYYAKVSYTNGSVLKKSGVWLDVYELFKAAPIVREYITSFDVLVQGSDKMLMDIIDDVLKNNDTRGSS